MLSGLLRIKDDELAFQEALCHSHTSDSKDGALHWSADVVMKAHGHLIGVALVKMPRLAGGPLQWRSRQERFWAKLDMSAKMRSRLCFMRIVDCVAIGPFAAGVQAYRLEEGKYVDSNDAALIPLPMQSAGQTSNPRTAFYKLLPSCIKAWLQLPCYRLSPHGWHGHHLPIPQGRVQDVVSAWARTWSMNPDLDNVGHRIWPPLAAAVLRGRWQVLGAVPPVLNSWSKYRHAGLWDSLFGHLRELRSSRKRRLEEWPS